jgi:hypothetical protein
VLLPVKETKVSVLYDAGLALEQALMLIGEQKNLFSTPGNRTQFLGFQSVAWLLYRLSYPASKEIMKDGEKENKHKLQKYLFSAIPLKTRLDLLFYVSPSTTNIVAMNLTFINPCIVI